MARARLPYQPVTPVRCEDFRAVFARLAGRPSAGAGWQRLLRAKKDFERALECAVDLKLPRQFGWLMERVDLIAGRRPAPSLAAAIARKSEIDGVEDGKLTQLAMAPADEATALQAFRHLLQERRATDDLLAALTEKWGFEV